MDSLPRRDGFLCYTFIDFMTDIFEKLEKLSQFVIFSFDNKNKDSFKRVLILTPNILPQNVCIQIHLPKFDYDKVTRIVT